jgi:hypothetical protein
MALRQAAAASLYLGFPSQGHAQTGERSSVLWIVISYGLPRVYRLWELSLLLQRHCFSRTGCLRPSQTPVTRARKEPTPVSRFLSAKCGTKGPAHESEHLE